MLCFRRNKGYKVVPKKKKVKATTSTSTSTNQTSTPRTRNGTATHRGNKATANKTRPLPDRYSDSRPSPSQKRNPEQRPPIQPPRRQSKVARTNDMSAQNSSFYGRVNSAITRGFEDDSSATAVQNRINKPQESSSSNTAQSQAYDTTPVPSTQVHFRYQRPSFLGDVDFTAESCRDIVVAHGLTSALSPRQGYRPTPASISNFADFDLENTDAKISDIRHDNISSHEQPITSIAAAAAASALSSSSAGPYLDLPESPDGDAVKASAIGSRECLACSDMKAPNSFPDFVTSKCTHTPSICLDCMVRSIQVAMKTEYWNEISCDECKEKLQYNDIQRFADEQTIAKYERQALRAAVADEENFFWCTSDCGSGQIHDSGSTQPIVVCIKCNHRSCFRHGVNWHEDLSCEEYDRLQDDPEFRSYLELENERWEEAQAAQEAQEEVDRDVARRLAAEEIAETERQEAQARRARERERERERERHREQERERETQQRQRERAHERQRNEERQREQKRERQEIQRERERRNQERQRQLEQERHQRQRQLEQQNQKRQRERERQRDQERQRQVERERHQRQRALRETASSRNAAEERRKIAARKREEESRSYATMRATSKPCGGCGWAIERSFGW
ncbi:RING finger Dorfin [Fusarium circinatum]|uniref:RING finger Dorfin n=1 Tax=Fusarium circinatum TaxID=48490 RepID=A0A8H5U1N6_FUSCI|nr:RING finger Dorfin [Fusarium circinatum]